jgi:hypothetical protein
VGGERTPGRLMATLPLARVKRITSVVREMDRAGEAPPAHRNNSMTMRGASVNAADTIQR